MAIDSRLSLRADARARLAVVMHHQSTATISPNTDGLKVAATSALLRLARDHHVGALFPCAAAGEPRRGEAACKSGVPRHPISVRPPEPDKLENFRGYKGAQSYPSRTKDTDDVDSDRLGRPRRRPDAVRLARARLRQGAWLDEGAPRRAHDRAAGRRRRDGRGKHLRSAAGRLEARLAQHLVGGRLQQPDPRRRRARRALGKIQNHVPQFRLGRGHREIRTTTQAGLRRARRRSAEALDRQLPERRPRCASRAAPPSESICRTTSATRARYPP